MSKFHSQSAGDGDDPYSHTCYRTNKTIMTVYTCFLNNTWNSAKSFVPLHVFIASLVHGGD